MKDKLKGLLEALDELGVKASVTVEGEQVASVGIEDMTVRVDIDNADAIGRILKSLK